ncbi:hypothetical protein [Desulfotomaculum copahuensis]|uniref:Uncharacterized protein n=1 Tax=Desulfotomaculum copahuensis TaxID=1838280 RepID=A0A1B7LIV2_9FIRM|nr:hypothetical protein [Desulfotomaculum copahuensis]OAT86392.1 hypothetical protein A6M21_02895 [Desulfotomaculum copahuensis]
MKKAAGFVLLIAIACAVLFFAGHRLRKLAYRTEHIGRDWRLLEKDYHSLPHNTILGLPRLLTRTSFISIYLLLFLAGLLIVAGVVYILISKKKKK